MKFSKAFEGYKISKLAEGYRIDTSLYGLNDVEYFPGLKLRNPPKEGHLLPFVYYYGLHSKQVESYLEAFTEAVEFSREKLKGNLIISSIP